MVEFNHKEHKDFTKGTKENMPLLTWESINPFCDWRMVAKKGIPDKGNFTTDITIAAPAPTAAANANAEAAAAEKSAPVIPSVDSAYHIAETAA